MKREQCPKCGGRLKIGRVRHHNTFTEKRRDCCDCPYGDKVHVRIVEEILAIIDVSRRAKQPKRKVRVRTFEPTQAKKPRQNTK